MKRMGVIWGCVSHEQDCYNPIPRPCDKCPWGRHRVMHTEWVEGCLVPEYEQRVDEPGRSGYEQSAREKI